MAEACSIDAYVRNKEGKVVVSNLWKDLIDFTNNNRPLTQQYYALGTNTNFLDSVRSRAKFDENGQITFASLKKLAKLKVSEDDIIKKVRVSFRNSNLTFEDAVDSVNRFNQNSQFKDKLLATIIEDSDGTYTVDVVARTKANETILNTLLKQKTLKDFLINQLKSLHCNVEFVENVSFRGQYDTTEIEKLYDGTYTLIRIAKGLPIELQNRVLSKEIGHFVVGVLGDDNKLIERLDKALSQDVVKAYVAKYEADSVLGINTKREVMGHLIGEAIYNKQINEEKSTPIGTLLQRIKAFVLRRFAMYKDEGRLLRALTEVDTVLDKAADGFIKGKSAYDLERVLNEERELPKEILYDSKQSDIYRGLQEVALERKRMVDLLKKYDFKTARKLEDKVNKLVDSFQNHNTQSDEDLRFLYRALLMAYNDVEMDLYDAQMTLSELDKVTNFTLKQNLMQYSKQSYEAGVRISMNTRAEAMLQQLLNNPEFKRLDPAHTEDITRGAVDSDLFIGTPNSVDLDSFDNTDSVFDDIENHSNSFLDSNGNVRRASGYYEDSDGKRYVRYHRLQEIDSNGNKIPSTQDSSRIEEEGSLRKAELGSRTDAFLRVMFDTKGQDFNGALQAANNTDVELNSGMSPKLFDINNENDKKYLETLQQDAIKLMQRWANQGIKWKSTNLVVSTELNQMRIAGEMDLLLKYPDGHVEVWDMKTSTKDTSDNGSPRKNVNYETQLNFYARALRDTGLDARVGGILQINPDFIDSTNNEFTLFQFHIKTRKSINSLMVKPFNAASVYLTDALTQQYIVENNNATNTTVTNPSKIEDDIDSRLADASEDAVKAYVVTYYPEKAKAVASWFSNGNNPTVNAPYKALYHFGILPTTNTEIRKFNNALQNNPTTHASVVASRVHNKAINLTQNFNNFTKRISCIWMADVYGNDLIKIASKGLRYGYTNDSLKKKHFYLSDDRWVSPEEALSELQRDLNYLEFLFHPIGRSIDIPAQLISKMVDTANARADRNTWELTKQLFDLKKKYNISRSDELALFERDEKGNLTGYYIDEVHCGRYNQDLDEFKKNYSINSEAFIEYCEGKLKTSFDNIDDTIKATTWSTWYGKEWKKFHNGSKHTVKDANGNPVVVSNGHSVKKNGVYVPNPNYHDASGNTRYYNPEYEKLTDKQKEFLKEIRAIKDSQDALLGDRGLTESQRAPQIEDSKKLDFFFNKTPGNIVTKGIRWAITKYFKLRNIDIEFGNDLSDMDKEDMLGDAYLDPRTHVSEVPMFFIKKVQHPNMMSTDIVGGLVAYVSMAQGYGALSSISSTIELVNHTLLDRSISRSGKVSDWIDRTINPIYKFAKDDLFSGKLDTLEHSRYARSLRAYLEMNLYSRREPVIQTKTKFALNKLKETLGALTTFRFLGGNVHGAAVNTLTGINEIWKEAVVDEDLSWDSAIKAHGLFMLWTPKVLLGMPDYKDIVSTIKDKKRPVFNYQIHQDKMSAWFRYFNSRGDNAFQDKHHEAVRMFPMTFSEFIMSPYSSGDYYMQGMSYLIAAIDSKVYDRNGNKYDFFDVYTNNEGVLELQPNQYFTSAEFAKDYDELRRIYNDIFTKQKLSHDENVNLNLTVEESELLRKYDVDVTALQSSDILNKLNYLFDNNVVGAAYEIQYMRKCRAVNDRMHGIYNKANKTTMHSSLVGSMLMSLRGYLLGYIERDWSDTREDVTLGRGTEGVYKTYFKYLGYSFTQGIGETMKALLFSTVGASLSTIPLVSNPLRVLVQKTLGKDISYENFMREHSDLGDFQIANLKRFGAKFNLIVLVQFILAPLCLKWGLGDPDDDSDDKAFWLIMYYVLKRASYEQIAASILLGAGVSIFTDDGFTTGWAQEINRNSSIVPVQTLSLTYWMQDLYYLAGLFAGYDNPDDVLFKEQGESTSDFNKRKKEYNEEHNKFWTTTHYTRDYNMNYERDSEGNIIEIDGTKVPVHKTPFSRALHGEYMAGDSKYLKRLISIIPFVKSYRVFNDSTKPTKSGKSVKSLDNWMYGQTTRQ